MRLLAASLLLLIALGLPAPAQNYTINTIAGGALPENIAGLSASLGPMQGVVVDKDGNTYFSLIVYNIVLKMDKDGRLTRVAGTGIAGTSGDNGPATSAQLNDPAGLAIDSHGSLYIGTFDSVRRVTGGIITTVLSSGGGGMGSGGTWFYINPPLLSIALDQSDNLFFSNGWTCQVLEWSNGLLTAAAGQAWQCGSGGDNGPADQAQLSQNALLALAFDSKGALYIADALNHRVRKVYKGTITTVAGDGTQGTTGAIGDGGPATSAQLNTPLGVTLDAFDNLYIADSSGTRIREVSGGTITTVGGGSSSGFSGDRGLASAATLGGVWWSGELAGLAADSSSNLLIGDFANYRLRRISAGAIRTINTIAGGGPPIGDSGPALQAQMMQPTKASLDAHGDLYVADVDDNRIRMISNGIISTFAGIGVVPGGYGGDNGPAASAQLYNPYAVAFDSAGSAYIADYANYRIRKVQHGIITTIAGTGTYGTAGENGPAIDAQLGGVKDLAFDSADNLYLADIGTGRVKKISNGRITTIAGNGGSGGSSGDNGPATSASVYPSAIAVGRNGDIYVADGSDSTIRKISNGVITRVAGDGTFGFGGDGGPATSAQFNSPYGLAIDSAGALYISDEGNERVRKVQNGIITTIAGDGTLGFGGDGGPATSASLNGPQGLSVGPDGSVYVAETGSNRIRVLTPPPAIAVTIATIPAGQTLTVDGQPVVAPAHLSWIPGATHSLSVPATISMGPSVRYQFSSWSQGGAAAQVVTTPNSAVAYTANFNVQFLLTTNAVGNGTISPPTQWYASGTRVPVVATTGTGSYFIGFSGSLIGGPDHQTLFVGGPASVSASFGNYAPSLTAMVTAKQNGSLPNERIWSLQITNSGLGLATNVVITSLKILSVTGAGPVTFSPAMSVPPVGTLAPGASAVIPVKLVFPATNPASRIQLGVYFAADGGYLGTAVLSNQFR